MSDRQSNFSSNKHPMEPPPVPGPSKVNRTQNWRYWTQTFPSVSSESWQRPSENTRNPKFPRYTTTEISREQCDYNRSTYNNIRPRHRLNSDNNPIKPFMFYCMQSHNIMQVLNVMNIELSNQVAIPDNEPINHTNLSQPIETITQPIVNNAQLEPQLSPSTSPTPDLEDIDGLFTIDTTPDISNLQKDRLFPEPIEPLVFTPAPTPPVCLPPPNPPVVVSSGEVISTKKRSKKKKKPNSEAKSTNQFNSNVTENELNTLADNQPTVENKLKKRKEKRKREMKKNFEFIKKIKLDNMEIITLSDSESNDSIVEVPLPKPPLIEISDEEDVESIDVEKLDSPHPQEPLNVDLEKNDSENSDSSSDTSENVFLTPNSKPREATEEIHLSPESRCSDDFMENDAMTAPTNSEYNFIYHNEGLRCDESNEKDDSVSNPKRSAIAIPKTTAKTSFMTDVYETESSCASDMLEPSSKAPKISSTPQSQERRYGELDLDHFACMITPNRPPAETVIRSSFFQSKISNSNVIKTKRNFAPNESDSSSEESDASVGASQRKKIKLNSEVEASTQPEDSSQKDNKNVEPSRESDSQQLVVEPENSNDKIDLTEISSEDDCEEVENASCSESEEDIDVETPDMLLNIDSDQTPATFGKNDHSVVISSTPINLVDAENKFDNIWTMDRNIFYNTSWGGENFNHTSEQLKMPFHPRAWSAPNDRYPVKCNYRKIRCLNCRQMGHTKSNCDVPIKKCAMCGKRTHREFCCPSACCLTCFSKIKERKYRISCNRCRGWRFKKCSICKINGHNPQDCPDLWRRYHLTTEPGKIVRPDKESTPQKWLWCPGCAGRGHLSDRCPLQKSFDFAQNSMTIHQYADVYKPERTMPKKPKENDNVNDSWSIHKMDYDSVNRSFVNQEQLNDEEEIEIVAETSAEVKECASATVDSTQNDDTIQDNSVSNSVDCNPIDKQNNDVMVLKISIEDAKRLFGISRRYAKLEGKYRVNILLKYMDEAAYVFIRSREPKHEEVLKSIFDEMIKFLQPQDKTVKIASPEIVFFTNTYVMSLHLLKWSVIRVKDCVNLCLQFIFSKLSFLQIFYESVILKTKELAKPKKKKRNVLGKRSLENMNAIWLRLRHNNKESNYRVLQQYVFCTSKKGLYVPPYVAAAFGFYFRKLSPKMFFQRLEEEILNDTSEPLSRDNIDKYSAIIGKLLLASKVHEVKFSLNKIKTKINNSLCWSKHDLSYISELQKILNVSDD